MTKTIAVSNLTLDDFVDYLRDDNGWELSDTLETYHRSAHEIQTLLNSEQELLSEIGKIAQREDVLTVMDFDMKTWAINLLKKWEKDQSARDQPSSREPDNSTDQSGSNTLHTPSIKKVTRKCEGLAICPFCGTKATSIDYEAGHYFVMCDECCCCGPSSSDPKEAIDKWNDELWIGDK
jgi:hypothetical protein